MATSDVRSLTVLIVGCGYVGASAALQLIERGHRVVGTTRTAGTLPRGVEELVIELAEPLPALPRCDVLVYGVSPGGFSEDAYRFSCVEAVTATFDALPAPPPLTIYLASTAVYAQVDGSEVDEASPTLPSGFSGSLVLEAEALVRERSSAGVSLRLGGIYGPGRTRFLSGVADGKIGLPESPRFTNRVHREDAGRMVAHLVGLHAAGVQPEAIYNGVDRDPAELGEVVRWIAAQVGRAPSEAGGTRRKSGRPVTNKRVLAKALERSGFTWRYPSFRDGYATML